MSFRCVPLAPGRGFLGGCNASPRLVSTAIVASVLVHALVLLGLLRLYRPIQPPAARQEPPRTEVLWIEFPLLNTVSPAVRAASGPPGAEQSPHPSPRTAELPQIKPAAAGELAHIPVPDQPQSSMATTAPSTPHAGSSALKSGFRDPRLFVDARAFSPGESRSIQERLQANADAAIRAHQDSIAEQRSQALAARQTTILGRRITVLGDSTAHHRAGLRHDLAGQKIITPGDGREWEDFELKKQEQDRERDLILRERVRAARERKDAERGAGRQPHRHPR